MEEENTYSYFMQVVAAINNANYSITLLNEVSHDKLRSHRLWPVRLPDLNPCDLHPWGPPSPQKVH
jgi:hypothetical protein